MLISSIRRIVERIRAGKPAAATKENLEETVLRSLGLEITPIQMVALDESTTKSNRAPVWFVSSRWVYDQWLDDPELFWIYSHSDGDQRDEAGWKGRGGGEGNGAIADCRPDGACERGQWCLRHDPTGEREEQGLERQEAVSSWPKFLSKL